jgi:hypothetical protein
MKLIQETNNKVNLEEKLLQGTLTTLISVCDNQTPLNEGIQDLRVNIRRYLVNNHDVDLSTAVRLGHALVFAEELERELGKSTKYSEGSLKNAMEQLLGVAIERATDKESPTKVADAIRETIQRLAGTPEMVETARKTFDKLAQRFESNDTVLHLRAMKIASSILKSNKDPQQRRELLTII